MNIIIKKKYEKKFFYMRNIFSDATFLLSIGARSDAQFFLDKKLHFYLFFFRFSATTKKEKTCNARLEWVNYYRNPDS